MVGTERVARGAIRDQPAGRGIQILVRIEPAVLDVDDVGVLARPAGDEVRVVGIDAVRRRVSVTLLGDEAGGGAGVVRRRGRLRLGIGDLHDAHCVQVIDQVLRARSGDGDVEVEVEVRLLAPGLLLDRLEPLLERSGGDRIEMSAGGRPGMACEHRVERGSPLALELAAHYPRRRALDELQHHLVARLAVEDVGVLGLVGDHAREPGAQRGRRHPIRARPATGGSGQGRNGEGAADGNGQGRNPCPARRCCRPRHTPSGHGPTLADSRG